MMMTPQNGNENKNCYYAIAAKMKYTSMIATMRQAGGTLVSFINIIYYYERLR